MKLLICTQLKTQTIQVQTISTSILYLLSYYNIIQLKSCTAEWNLKFYNAAERCRQSRYMIVIPIHKLSTTFKMRIFIQFTLFFYLPRLNLRVL